MPLKSKTSIARPKSKSLRATVPEGIAEFLSYNRATRWNGKWTPQETNAKPPSAKI